MASLFAIIEDQGREPSSEDYMLIQKKKDELLRESQKYSGVEKVLLDLQNKSKQQNSIYDPNRVSAFVQQAIENDLSPEEILSNTSLLLKRVDPAVLIKKTADDLGASQKTKTSIETPLDGGLTRTQESESVVYDDDVVDQSILRLWSSNPNFVVSIMDDWSNLDNEEKLRMFSDIDGDGSISKNEMSVDNASNRNVVLDWIKTNYSFGGGGKTLDKTDVKGSGMNFIFGGSKMPASFSIDEKKTSVDYGKDNELPVFYSYTPKSKRISVTGDFYSAVTGKKGFKLPGEALSLDNIQIVWIPTDDSGAPSQYKSGGKASPFLYGVSDDEYYFVKADDLDKQKLELLGLSKDNIKQVKPIPLKDDEKGNDLVGSTFSISGSDYTYDEAVGVIIKAEPNATRKQINDSLRNYIKK